MLRSFVAGPVREQPHWVLAGKALVTADGSAPSGAAPFAATRAQVLGRHYERAYDSNSAFCIVDVLGPVTDSSALCSISLILMTSSQGGVCSLAKFRRHRPGESLA